MNKWLKIVFPIVALVAAIAASFILFATRPAVEHQQVEIKIPLVSVSPVKSQSMHIPVFTRGTVTPGTQIQLVSEVSGQVLEVSPNFANGGFFQKGDVLVRVDPLEYDVNIKRAEASKAQAYQAFVQAEAERKARSRVKSTNKDPLARFEVQYRQAEAQYLAAKAELEAVTMQKSRTIIRAPFDGRVMLSALNVGQYLRPGIQIGAIYAVDIAEVRLPLSDRQLSLVDVPMRMTQEDDRPMPEVVFSEEYAGKTFTWKGQVVRAEGGVDERNRLLYLVAQVPDPYGSDPSQPGRPELVAGSFVEAKISGRKFERVFAVPRKALRNGSQIWIVGDDGRLSKRDIGILYKAKDMIYVSTGIDDGDQVVLSQLDIAVEGMRVRTQTEESLQELQEQPKEKNPFAGRTPIDPAISAALTKTPKGVALNISKDQAKDLAKQARTFVDNMDEKQKQDIKDNAAKLAEQIEMLQASMKKPAAEVEKNSAEPPATTQSSDTPAELQQKSSSMSPLAAQLEQDIEQQKTVEAPVEPDINQPAVTSAPASSRPEKQNLLADSAKGSSVVVISTVAAPKPLLEANQ